MKNLNTFVTFAQIVETGSFSRAADRLGISKALVSKQVMELEQTLGVRLLNRTTRRLGLTAAGAVFHERCRDLIAHAESAVDEVEQFRSAPGGLVKISAAISFGRSHLAPAIAEFLMQNPAMQVELDFSNSVADLVSGGPDLIIRQLDDQKINTLVARKLAPMRWVLCASPGYLARYGRPVAPAELTERNCIVYRASTRSHWSFTRPDGQTETVRVAGNFQGGNADGALAAARAGLGIAAVPTFAAWEALRDGHVERVLEDHHMAEGILYAAFLPNTHTARRIHALLRFLIERFGPEPYWDQAVGAPAQALTATATLTAD